jgi:electron-transferring-flavoprotein dehydrogenase
MMCGGAAVPAAAVMTFHCNVGLWATFSELTRWLAGKAEELGVEIYPGFAGGDPLCRQQFHRV